MIRILKVVVCDDDAASCERTRTLMLSYFQMHTALDGKVWACFDGQTLLELAAQQGGFDIYLLDILMPELNGIETGRRLRARGDRGEIVYLTNSNDFAADSYDVRALSYLLKPVEETKLFRVLDEAAEKLRRQQNCSTVVYTVQGPQRIPLEQIRYCDTPVHCHHALVFPASGFSRSFQRCYRPVCRLHRHGQLHAGRVVFAGLSE